MSVITTIKVLYCANGECVNNGQHGLQTHSIHYSNDNIINNEHGLETLRVNRPLENWLDYLLTSNSAVLTCNISVGQFDVAASTSE